MENIEMGRVTATVKVENLQDLWDVERGLLKPDQVRSVEAPDALVDTGATMLSLPSRLIGQLGLKKLYDKNVLSSIGSGRANVYQAARITIQDRFCNLDILEVPDSVPVLIGQIPMEQLDFVADHKRQALIGNPAHGGEHALEAYGCAVSPESQGTGDEP